MYQQLPINVLSEKSLIWAVPIESQEFARRMDDEDQFSSFRELFTFPKKKDLPFGKIYFTIILAFILLVTQSICARILFSIYLKEFLGPIFVIISTLNSLELAQHFSPIRIF